MVDERPVCARRIMTGAILLSLLGAPAASVWSQEEKGPANKHDDPARKKPETAPSSDLPKAPDPPDDSQPSDDGSLKDFIFTTDEAIQFFQARVKRDPKDYISYRYLGEMYERKARESGDHAGFAPAEVALRKSLELFPTYTRAQSSLAAVLCARHKFAEGLAIASKLVDANPKDIDAIATKGDALFELGRYAEAEAAFQKLHQLAQIPEALARLASIAEAKGKVDEAESLMTKALEMARKSGGDKAAAWYLWRLGDLAFDTGRLEDAAKRYSAVPEGVDPFHDATAGLARVRAAQGKTDEAIELYKKAIAIGPDAHMLAALGDIYTRAGKPELAEPLYIQLVKQISGLAENRRNLAIFYLEHDKELPRALELMREDFSERQDIHGRDWLAWALYKNGKPEEAAKIIADAVALGVKDARILYHAGMIELALGHRDRARELFRQSLSANPSFDIAAAKEMRNVLAGDRLQPAPGP